MEVVASPAITPPMAEMRFAPVDTIVALDAGERGVLPVAPLPVLLLLPLTTPAMALEVPVMSFSIKG